MLNEIGQNDVEDLETWEVEGFVLVASVIADIRNKEMEKASKIKKKR